jgi:hypothetical protein
MGYGKVDSGMEIIAFWEDEGYGRPLTAPVLGIEEVASTVKSSSTASKNIHTPSCQ